MWGDFQSCCLDKGGPAGPLSGCGLFGYRPCTDGWIKSGGEVLLARGPLGVMQVNGAGVPDQSGDTERPAEAASTSFASFLLYHTTGALLARQGLSECVNYYVPL